jgi:uracil-DNA glycosylase family protein
MKTLFNLGAEEFLPQRLDYESLRRAASVCEGCDLYKSATQTVFGEGPTKATVMFVGEVPGDEEDKSGHPFVGPAGRLLDRALDEAGIQRELVYMTNAVKHFKWKPSGKRRLHEKPNASAITACKPWLESEIALLKPRIVVCLGATAAQTLFGRDFRVTRMRGSWMEFQNDIRAIATVHPSSILRTPEPDREAAYSHFEADLELVAVEIKRSGLHDRGSAATGSPT